MVWWSKSQFPHAQFVLFFGIVLSHLAAWVCHLLAAMGAVRYSCSHDWPAVRFWDPKFRIRVYVKGGYLFCFWGFLACFGWAQVSWIDLAAAVLIGVGTALYWWEIQSALPLLLFLFAHVRPLCDPTVFFRGRCVFGWDRFDWDFRVILPLCLRWFESVVDVFLSIWLVGLSTQTSSRWKSSYGQGKPRRLSHFVSRFLGDSAATLLAGYKSIQTTSWIHNSLLYLAILFWKEFISKCE